MQSYSNGPGHMTNMASMPIYGKTYKNQADGLETWYVAYGTQELPIFKEALAIRHIFSLVDMITKTKFSNRRNVFKIGLFR